MAHKISVGYYFDDTAKGGAMVGLTMGRETMGLSPELARDIAVDLLIWADRIAPQDNKSNEEV